MEELLPGLVRVMEERLGRIGRPLTTIVVTCLGLGAAAWGINAFWVYLVIPISHGVQDILQSQAIDFQKLINILPSIGIAIVIYALFWFISIKTIINPAKRWRSEELAKKIFPKKLRDKLKEVAHEKDHKSAS